MNLSTEQFEKLLAAIGSQRSGSFATSKVSYNGTRDTECVEAFLTAATVFKSVEKINDEDAIQSLPLILKDEAATWWNGVKENITSWDDFQSRLRHAFAPKRPPYQVYQDIIGIKQGEDEMTEVFIAKKRALFAQLPEPAHTEIQQIDMVYGQLRYKIREKMPRELVSNFDALLKAARSAERLLVEKQAQASSDGGQVKEKEKNTDKPKKSRCSFCRMPGHTVEVCRRKQSASASTSSAASKPEVAASATQAPSPNTPKFACYGCGAPGVVRSRCPNCSTKSPKDMVKSEISFCSLNVKTDVRPRPIIGIGVGKIVGNAYVDSCAKTSVASYELYQCLVRLGYHFDELQVVVTLADGGKTQRNVLTVRVPINLCDRIVPTMFIIFPEARESRTLLGIGFIQDAGMVLNIPQMCWHFVDDPDIMYDLNEEDVQEVSMSRVEMSPLSSPSFHRLMEDVQPPEFISPLVITPPSMSEFYKQLEEDYIPEPVSSSTDEPSFPEPSACAATDLVVPGNSRRNTEPALPENSACPTIPYRAIPIEPASPPKKRVKTLFDGYSPKHVDFMYRDAQMNVHRADVELSPYSRNLFPSDGSDDVEIGSISIEDVTSDTLDTAQKTQLMEILWKNQAAFEGNTEPTSLAEHCINTAPAQPSRGRGRPKRTGT